jgi:hypothetical protein
VLRHQLRVLTRGGKRPRFNTADRAFLAAASRFLPRERWSAFGVVPDTIKRWCRQLDAGKGRRPRRGPGRPPIDPELRQLILRLGREIPRWGYLRIKGELLKLGIRISATTIATVLRRGGLGPAPRRIGPTWGSSCGPKPWPSSPPAPPPPTWRIGLGASRALRLRRRMSQNHSRPTRRLAPWLLPVGIPPVISRGGRVPFRPLNSADRRSLAAVRFRCVVRRSMRPPDRILGPNRQGPFDTPSRPWPSRGCLPVPSVARGRASAALRRPRRSDRVAG